MKKFVCLITALLIAISLVVPAMAAEEFVPSISYKGGPRIIDAQLDGEDVTGCVIVTSIKEAKEKTTDIKQEERDLLLEVYEKLENGTMELPNKKGYTIRELVDISFAYEACRAVDAHNHKDETLRKEKVTLTINFNMGLAAGTKIGAMAYIDGKWAPIESVEVGANGVLTCVFEDLCPVAFYVMDDNGDTTNPQTGDAVGQNLGLWIGLMVVCAAGVVALVVIQRKKSK